MLTSTNLQTLGNVCGTSVYASSGTCFFKIDNSDNISSGDCLTVGKGVAITTAAGVELTCDDDSCGSAIKSSASGSGNTTIDDLTVLGCWTRGIEAVTSNDVITNSTINLGHYDSSFACNMDNHGVFGSPSRIESTVISGSHNGSNLGTTCVNTAGKVQDSVLKNCKYGAATQNGGEYDNAVFWNNYIALTNSSNAALKGSSIVAGSNTYSPGGIDCNCYAGSSCVWGAGGTMKSSHVVTGPNTYLDWENDDFPCHCAIGGGSDCPDLSACFNFAGQTSFVDDTMFQ